MASIEEPQQFGIVRALDFSRCLVPQLPPLAMLEIINQRTAVPFRTADGSTIRELLAHRNSSICQQSLAEARLAPGQSTTPHHHKITEEIYFILNGTAEMTLNSDTQPVGPGDAIAIPPNARHTIKNTGLEELVFLCTCAPGYEPTDTFLENHFSQINSTELS